MNKKLLNDLQVALRHLDPVDQAYLARIERPWPFRAFVLGTLLSPWQEAGVQTDVVCYEDKPDDDIAIPRWDARDKLGLSRDEWTRLFEAPTDISPMEVAGRITCLLQGGNAPC